MKFTHKPSLCSFLISSVCKWECRMQNKVCQAIKCIILSQFEDTINSSCNYQVKMIKHLSYLNVATHLNKAVTLQASYFAFNLKSYYSLTTVNHSVEQFDWWFEELKPVIKDFSHCMFTVLPELTGCTIFICRVQRKHYIGFYSEQPPSVLHE